MAEADTIRERVARAAAHLTQQEAVVLTTFNLDAPFLEEQVLPVVLGVEAATAPARRAATHQRLAETACTVFYDPTTSPKLSGRYRYVARPVPLRGRFFHPKLVIMAGRRPEGDAETHWVYLAVASANLTLSGWGRNAESFAETWIHTRKQQTWGAVDRLLAWLQDYGHLGEPSAATDAVARARQVLERMPDRRRFIDDAAAPWSGTLYAQLYFSMDSKRGLAHFLQQDFRRSPDELWVYSPYWGEVAERVEAFNARSTVLVPARRRFDAALGLDQQQAQGLPKNVEIHCNDQDDGARFWHLKAFWLKRGDRTFTAVGSCNFSRAGLIGSDGNAEAMLVYETDYDCLPASETVELGALTSDAVVEEDAPSTAPVIIVVAFDWRSRRWRWWLEAGPNQDHFILSLPGVAESLPTSTGVHDHAGRPPSRGSRFEVAYQERGIRTSWQGQVVELNLEHSSRTYGRPLSAVEILDSWRGRSPGWGGGGGGGGEGDDETDDIEHQPAAAFDALNLYDLYRSLRVLRQTLAAADTADEVKRSLLVGRPDSVLALAHLANRDEEAPVVRYLVLFELYRIVREGAELLDDALVQVVREMTTTARDRAGKLLAAELGDDQSRSAKIMDWFQQELGRLDQDPK